MKINPIDTTMLRSLLACWLLLLFTQCNSKEEEARDREQQTIEALVRDEEAVLEVTTLAGKIADSIKNKVVVSAATRSLFAEEIVLTDLLESDQNSRVLDAAHGIASDDWGLGERQSITLDEAEQKGIWKDLLGTLNNVSAASFGFVSGKSADGVLLETLLKFSAKGLDANTQPISVGGKVGVDWVRSGDSWKITSWRTESMATIRRKELLFRDAMPRLFNARDLELATRSFHEEKLTQYIEEGETRLPKTEYNPYFKPESDYQHPAVSVVDINGDGWDDLFVTSLWAHCQLWVNHGGKRFSEEASAYGLDVLACNTSAIFADFDNDGDADLILGRSLERSQLFWNEAGYFSASEEELPYLVTSASAADCNNDGLLDIYLCTYGLSGTSGDSAPGWINEFLPPETHSSLHAALADGHRYYDQAGPCNYLLINRGGRRFETAPADPALDQYHNSYQGSWADYDKDGDVDLYVCNDFAPDSLLRNEGWGEKGIPRFTDVSMELSGDTMKGFGMGASWGDFDNAQQPDLFVTNMYSKAGKRVLSRFDDVDERLHFSARGNLLFRQRDGKFEQLAGESDALAVHQGGWAFGGQFVDFDNDAWLDLYVPNGFYTAPQRVASQVDL